MLTEPTAKSPTCRSVARFCPPEKFLRLKTFREKKETSRQFDFFCLYGAHLHLRRLVVAAVFVLVSGAVAVTQEALKAVLAPQLSHDLVERLTVERVVVHGKGWIADGGKQGCVCVLPETKCSHYTK